VDVVLETPPAYQSPFTSLSLYAAPLTRAHETVRPTVLAGGRARGRRGILDRSFQSVGSPLDQRGRPGVGTLYCPSKQQLDRRTGDTRMAPSWNRKDLRRTLRAAWRESAVHDSMHSQLRTALPPRSIRTGVRSGSRDRTHKKIPHNSLAHARTNHIWLHLVWTSGRTSFVFRRA